PEERRKWPLKRAPVSSKSFRLIIGFRIYQSTPALAFAAEGVFERRRGGAFRRGSGGGAVGSVGRSSPHPGEPSDGAPKAQIPARGRGDAQASLSRLILWCSFCL